MNEITRCIHEAEEHAAQLPYHVREREFLVLEFLRERLAMLDILDKILRERLAIIDDGTPLLMLDILDKSGDMFLETCQGLGIAIAGYKARLEPS
jgi:hypothetical protein